MPAQLTPIDSSSVVRRPNYRGIQETVEARSSDGLWSYERGEEAGTPWHIHHLPTGGVLEHAATTYKGARYLTANKTDWLLTQMTRRAQLAAKGAA